MTEFEIVEAYMSSQSMAMSAMVIYLTIVSGYLIAAYMAGANLTRSQLLFISSLFVMFSLFSVWGSVAYFAIGDQYGYQSDTLGIARYRLFGITPPIAVGLVELLGILGCLLFMRDIRSAENSPEHGDRTGDV